MCPGDPCEWYSGLDLSFLSTRDVGLMFNGRAHAFESNRATCYWSETVSALDYRCSYWMRQAGCRYCVGAKGCRSGWERGKSRQRQQQRAQRHDYVPQAKRVSATVRGIGPSQSELSMLLTAADAGRSCGVWLSNFNGDVKPLSDARSRRRLPFTQARCFARPKWFPVPWLRVWQ